MSAEPQPNIISQLRMIRWQRVLLWIAIGGVMFVALYPVVWALITSFKRADDALQATVIPFLQFQPTLDNWSLALTRNEGRALVAFSSSLVIALGAALVALLLGTLAGYGLARYRYGIGNRTVIAWLLAQRLLPPVATIIPVLLIFEPLRLTDSYIGLIAVNTTFVLPFAVLIMRDCFAELPPELREQALVDGANDYQAFRRIALPLARPALAAAAVICFAFAWNEFMFASVLAGPNTRTFPLLVSSGSAARESAYGFVAARALMAVALPVVASLLVQRFIVRGLTFGVVRA
ncbi:MAG: carbohydrate ABC transporter permease [Chloroflexi bacterium]|nr:carbohydrate ABC transporter permease [Chloroflexota bacterium]